MHSLFLTYFVTLYMFLAYLDPSSGGTTVCIQRLVLLILFRWPSAAPRTTDSHLFFFTRFCKFLCSLIAALLQAEKCSYLGLQRQIQAVFNKFLLALDNDDIRANLSSNSKFPLYANNNIKHRTCVPYCRQRRVQLNSTDRALLSF